MTMTRGKATVTLENFIPNESYNENFVKLRTEINKLCLGKRQLETHALKNNVLVVLTNLNKQYEENDNLGSIIKTLNSEISDLKEKCRALEKKTREDHIFIQECIDDTAKLENVIKKHQKPSKTFPWKKIS